LTPGAVSALTLGRIAACSKANRRANRENQGAYIRLTRDDETDSGDSESTVYPSGILPPPKIAPAVRKQRL